MFSDTEVIRACINTMIVAVCASIISTILGGLACIGVVNTNKKNNVLLINLTNIPIISPEIVTGVSSMLFFVFLNKISALFRPGLFTLIIVHSTFCAPYTFLAIFPKVRQIIPQNFDAARDLGCSSFQAFLKIILPEIVPGIISGIMLALAMSIDDFVISYFTCGNIQTLPVLIYSMTRKSISPEINALSSIIFLVVLILLLLVNFIKKSQKK
ncbi:MAG: spermidine/putrescine ABC transporter permease component II [Candidatus Improbicoccus devescovinae]|nr:MAG: spermidine/putrescine ABC transporter permease component II [Candidatus Improbicoccus devescovinae]